MAFRVQLVLCAILSSGCAETILGPGEARGSTFAGDSTESGGGPAVSKQTAVESALFLNPALVDGAPSSLTSAYEELLLSPKQALGTVCGPTGGPTKAWSAVSQIVNSNRADMLRDLSIRATTTEARAAAIVGLAKLRSISYANAEHMLRGLPGMLTICMGRDEHAARTEAATELLYVPIVGQSNELAIP